MNTGKRAAHVGLGLVTYVPLVLYVFFSVFVSPDNVFGDGFWTFLGYFVTMMTMFGWMFWIAALIISIRGLVKHESTKINMATFLICVGWLIVLYWVMTHFA